jgi:hypothetical protein
MTKKKVKLRIDPDYNFSLIGIASHENDYRLSWALNRDLGFKLIKSEDIEIHPKNTDIIQSFVKYSYYNEEVMLEFDLISNFCDNGHLVKELPNIDYFLKISGEFTVDYMNSLFDQVKNVDIVLSAFNMEPASLKNPQFFIFD